jgi:hypothetical protein
MCQRFDVAENLKNFAKLFRTKQGPNTYVRTLLPLLSSCLKGSLGLHSLLTYAPLSESETKALHIALHCIACSAVQAGTGPLVHSEQAEQGRESGGGPDTEETDDAASIHGRRSLLCSSCERHADAATSHSGLFSPFSFCMYYSHHMPVRSCSRRFSCCHFEEGGRNLTSQPGQVSRPGQGDGGNRPALPLRTLLCCSSCTCTVLDRIPTPTPTATASH